MMLDKAGKKDLDTSVDELVMVTQIIYYHHNTVHLRWLPPVLHFLEPLNFTKGFLAHHDGLLPVLARWCYNSF